MMLFSKQKISQRTSQSPARYQYPTVQKFTFQQSFTRFFLVSLFALILKELSRYRSARAIAELSTHLTLHPIPFCQEFSKILPVSLKVPPPPSDLTLALGQLSNPPLPSICVWGRGCFTDIMDRYRIFCMAPRFAVISFRSHFPVEFYRKF